MTGRFSGHLEMATQLWCSSTSSTAPTCMPLTMRHCRRHLGVATQLLCSFSSSTVLTQCDVQQEATQWRRPAGQEL